MSFFRSLLVDLLVPRCVTCLGLFFHSASPPPRQTGTSVQMLFRVQLGSFLLSLLASSSSCLAFRSQIYVPCEEAPAQVHARWAPRVAHFSLAPETQKAANEQTKKPKNIPCRVSFSKSRNSIVFIIPAPANYLEFLLHHLSANVSLCWPFPFGSHVRKDFN